jgi:hypothetical protein
MPAHLVLASVPFVLLTHKFMCSKFNAVVEIIEFLFFRRISDWRLGFLSLAKGRPNSCSSQYCHKIKSNAFTRNVTKPWSVNPPVCGTKPR